MQNRNQTDHTRPEIGPVQSVEQRKTCIEGPKRSGRSPALPYPFETFRRISSEGSTRQEKILIFGKISRIVIVCLSGEGYRGTTREEKKKKTAPMGDVRRVFSSV
jgi:hypothetical protein